MNWVTRATLRAPYLIGLLISSYHAHSLDEGVAGVVHASLDTLVQGVAVGRHLVAELGVNGRGEALGHAVVVLAQIGVVCTACGGHGLSEGRPKRGGLGQGFVSAHPSTKLFSACGLGTLGSMT